MESCYSRQRRFLISVFLLNVLIYWGGYWKVSGCFDSERKALTTIQKALNDPSNILSSWDDASDSCKWRGITCHNTHYDGFLINGGIDPALVELQHLQLLDLSFNALDGAPIPDFLGSMKELRHLDLSWAGFGRRIPHQLGNVPKLISLDLSYSSLSAKNLWCLTSLPSLNYLDMSYVNLSMASHDWVHVMNMSPSLIELALYHCGLSYISPILPSVNFTSLRLLDPYLLLGSTDDNLRVDLSEFLEGSWRKLKILHLSFSQLHGGIPISIWNMTSLESLFLNACKMHAAIPDWLYELKNLKRLSLSDCMLTGPIPAARLGGLSSLEELDLSGSQLNGNIPAALGGLSSLVELDLSWNQLNGTIPTTLGQLSNLFLLDLSNVFEVDERDDPALVELKHLQFLDLSFNAFHGAPIPDFLGSMKDLRHLNLSDAGFSGSIPHQLGNLSKLISLKLSSDYSLSAKNLWWLTSLPSLNYLDMSFVNLSMASHDWVHVMNMSPSLVELRLLDCGLSYISPTLPSVNFTSLRVLDLRFNDFNSTIPNWIANISSLVSLYLSRNNFHGEVPYQFSLLPNLEELWFGSTDDNLRVDWSEFLEGSWRKLKKLHLSFSQLPGGIPNSISNMISLEFLGLSFGENITGSIPRAITKLINLESLSLYGYKMHAAIPDWLHELKNLKHLSLQDCMLTGPIPAARLGGLSSLEELDLSRNQLNGNIPAALGGLSSLQELSLQENQLNGTIPTTLGQLSNLGWLDLSDNSLTGNVSESVFENLKKLTSLYLSSNSLVFVPHSDWAPPFQLFDIYLSSCHLGPRFPLWLRTQKYVQVLDLSDTTISGIIPTWFWDLTPQLRSLNLSNNHIFGQLPNPLKMQPQSFIDLSSNHFNGPIPCILNGARVLDLSNNQFSAPIPPNFTSTMQYLEYFCAKGNQINGTIPSFIEGMKSLTVLDLSRNNIGGIIPLSLGNCVALEAVDLSNNRLSGEIPRSLGQLRRLRTMHLSNNSLSGKIPLSLKKSSSLETMDLGYNNFSGHIPTWISKSFPTLRILRLRSNMFTGNIPSQLLNLTSLQLLDVAQNCLSGSIPQSFENLMAMKNEQKINHVRSYGGMGSSYYEENLLVSMKGLVLEYTRTVSLVTCMDLSRNNLSGEIPEGFTGLLGLRALNLSGNHLTGKIPDKIGKLALLESLDFSENQLSGTIPLSMSNLTFLSCLNLSFNNLWGKIPSGNQLQTFQDPSIYMGNIGLCGPPLLDKCVSDETPPGPGYVEKDEEEDEMRWFYSGLGPGFAVGFWALCGILVLKRSWRIVYYRFFDKMKDRLF
ncbi:receptor-like protein EIX1 [Magnolia sinica]|uniref:receptor-like protein EIX1 n=1 Tax=Magnolia sinica TaxID=86752 RepID=UPI002657ED1A|nr:receptor-like protein EIX1 [Magnolia sinica]